VSPLPLDQYDPALAASARSASRSSSRDRNELEELKVAALFSEKIEVVDEDFNRELTKSFICKGETTAWILKSDVDYNNIDAMADLMSWRQRDFSLRRAWENGRVVMVYASEQCAGADLMLFALFWYRPMADSRRLIGLWLTVAV